MVCFPDGGKHGLMLPWKTLTDSDFTILAWSFEVRGFAQDVTQQCHKLCVEFPARN